MSDNDTSYRRQRSAAGLAIAALILSAAHAQASVPGGARVITFWEGTCSNLTTGTAGHMKILTMREGRQVEGLMSMTGWTPVSGDLAGERKGDHYIMTGTGELRPFSFNATQAGHTLIGGFHMRDFDGAGEQAGIFSLRRVLQWQPHIATPEAARARIWRLSFELMMNDTGLLEAEAGGPSWPERICKTVRNTGEGISVHVTDADITWKPAADRDLMTSMQTCRIQYTLYWCEPGKPPGSTPMLATLNSDGRTFTHTIHEPR